MFTPTKEQIEELGFTDYNDEWLFYKKWWERKEYYHKSVWFYSIEYIPSNKKQFHITNTANNIDVYPQSIEDLQILINILNPKNNIISWKSTNSDSHKNNGMN